MSECLDRKNPFKSDCVKKEPESGTSNLASSEYFIVLLYVLIFIVILMFLLSPFLFLRKFCQDFAIV